MSKYCLHLRSREPHWRRRAPALAEYCTGGPREGSDPVQQRLNTQCPEHLHGTWHPSRAAPDRAVRGGGGGEGVGVRVCGITAEGHILLGAGLVPQCPPRLTSRDRLGKTKASLLTGALSAATRRRSRGVWQLSSEHERGLSRNKALGKLVVLGLNFNRM